MTDLDAITKERDTLRAAALRALASFEARKQGLAVGGTMSERITDLRDALGLTIETVSEEGTIRGSDPTLS